MKKFFLVLSLFSLLNASEDYSQIDCNSVVVNIDVDEEQEMQDIGAMQVAELVRLKQELQDKALEITRLRNEIEDLKAQGQDNNQLKAENNRLKNEVAEFQNKMKQVESIKKHWSCCPEVNCSCFSGLVKWFKNLKCCYKKQRNH